jgi:hypothetical protein
LRAISTTNLNTVVRGVIENQPAPYGAAVQTRVQHSRD